MVICIVWIFCTAHLQHVLRNNAMFFAELKLNILISVLFYRHTHDQKSKAEHWHHLSIKRGYQGDRMLSVGKKFLQVSQYPKKFKRSHLLRYICCGSALLNGLSLCQYQVLAGVTVYLAPPPHHPGSLSPTRGSLPPIPTQENLANSFQNNIYFL